MTTGDNQQVRAAVVEVSDPKRHRSLLKSSVQYLYPIEIRDEDIADVPTTEEESVTVSQVNLNHISCQEAEGKERIKAKTQLT